MLHLQNTTQSDIQKEKEALVTPLFCEPDTLNIGDQCHHSTEISDYATQEITTMNQGFIRIPRSVLTNPAYKSFSPQQKIVVQKLFELAAYHKQQIYIGEEIVEIEPYQLFYSIRYLVDACNDGVRLSEHHVIKNDVERILKVLGSQTIIRQEVRHGRTLITLLCLMDCDKENSLTQTGTQTKHRQNTDKTQTNTKKEKKEKKEKTNTPRAERASSADALELANSLFSSIQKWKPNFLTPDLNKWGIDLDKMLKTYPKERILSVVTWLPESEFWRKNILSPSKLHKQFERLESEVQSYQNSLHSKKNIQFFMECKKDNPELLKHAILKGNYILFGNTGKDLSIGMNHKAFEQAFLGILGARYA